MNISGKCVLDICESGCGRVFAHFKCECMANMQRPVCFIILTVLFRPINVDIQIELCLMFKCSMFHPQCSCSVYAVCFWDSLKKHEYGDMQCWTKRSWIWMLNHSYVMLCCHAICHWINLEFYEKTKEKNVSSHLKLELTFQQWQQQSNETKGYNEAHIPNTQRS